MVDIEEISVPTLGITETDAQARRRIFRALRDDFNLKDLSGDIVAEAEERQTCDLIIYDLGAGVTQLKLFRKAQPMVPILLLAPQKLTPALQKALELDMVDFVTKPVDAMQLHVRVNRCLRDSRRPWPWIENLKAISLMVPLQELHSPSGRLSGAAIAEHLGVPLTHLASAIGANYTTLHKTPDSTSIQSSLIPIKRVLTILTEMLGPWETVRAWLKSPHPVLGNRTPIEVILEGHADVIAGMLENALAGIPA